MKKKNNIPGYIRALDYIATVFYTFGWANLIVAIGAFVAGMAGEAGAFVLCGASIAGFFVCRCVARLMDVLTPIARAADLYYSKNRPTE